MGYEKTDCIILDVKPSGESDKTVLLCAREFGKITAVAVGALKPAARLSSSLEPFRETRAVVWARPGSFRNRITSAVALETFEGIFESPSRIAAAFACARVYCALTPYFEPDIAKYNLLRRAFELLSRSEKPAAVSMALSLRMLKISGYDFARQCPRGGDAARAVAHLADKFSRLSGDELSHEEFEGETFARLAGAVDEYIAEIAGLTEGRREKKGR